MDMGSLLGTILRTILNYKMSTAKGPLISPRSKVAPMNLFWIVKPKIESSSYESVLDRHKGLKAKPTKKVKLHPPGA